MRSAEHKCRYFISLFILYSVFSVDGTTKNLSGALGEVFTIVFIVRKNISVPYIKMP